MLRRIGLVIGEEDSFARALFERFEHQSDVVLELAHIGGTPERLVSRYDVVLDRMSHRVPHYRAHLKAAAVAGACVVNDPRRVASDDRFVALSTAARLGVPTARAALLPQKRYAPGIAVERELKNLEYPLDWEAIAGYVGLPAILRPVQLEHDDGTLVHDMGALWAAYDASGERVMMLEQHFEDAPVVRCLCIGERMIPLGHEHPLFESEALAVSRALGHALNAVDMAIVNGKPRVVDASRPMPDLRREHLGGGPFEASIEALSGLLLRAAHGEPPA